MKQKNKGFSRKHNLKQIMSNKHDLLIIGGGITGAGIALDAASRGMSVALLEKDDFASGTSSRSTKLVHGGLRYLEHLELALVREVGREREIVHNNAAHIVFPEKMILPIIEHGSLGEFTTSLALYVYDYLAGVKKTEHRKMLTKEKVVKKEPLIDSDLLKGGALYYEYKTDDARLTIEALKKAADFDALAANYCEVTDFVTNKKGKVKGVKVLDKISGETYEVFAKVIVNATGPWVDGIRKKDNSLEGKSIHHTKGIHIVVKKDRFPLQHAIYFDVGDNRMIFAIPRFDIVYIGTTDTDYKGKLENPPVEKKDVEYLLQAINRIAPTANLEITDVQSTWSGLRPLIHEDGKAPSELSRKDEIFLSKSGLISIAGGKLTGYRIMAKNVVDKAAIRIEKKDGITFGKCITKNLRLSGGEFDFYPEVGKLVEYADSKYDLAKQTGISVQQFKNLFYRYGTNIDKLTEKAFDFFNETKDSEKAWMKAEIWYNLENEMIIKPSDFLIRRSGLIFFDIHRIKEIMPTVLDEMAKFHKWDNNTKEQYVAEFDEDFKHATVWK